MQDSETHSRKPTSTIQGVSSRRLSGGHNGGYIPQNTNLEASSY